MYILFEKKKTEVLKRKKKVFKKSDRVERLGYYQAVSWPYLQTANTFGKKTKKDKNHFKLINQIK